MAYIVMAYIVMARQKVARTLKFINCNKCKRKTDLASTLNLDFSGHANTSANYIGHNYIGKYIPIAITI